MKIQIGSDHAAYSAKERLKSYLQEAGHEIIDVGTESEASCDYPVFAAAVAEAVSGNDDMLGILICGTGIGMSIMANKFPGVRAALCHNEETAQMSRAHNNANILCLGARILDFETLKKIMQTWLETPFEGGRHVRRLEMIEQAEQK